MSDFLVHDAGDEDGDPTIDPATDFGRPASQRLLVVGLTDLELDFADTSISNGPSYTDTQLARAQQTSFKGDWSSLLQTRAPAAETDSRLRVQYGWARTAAPGMPTVSAENLDLVTGSVTYNDRKLRHALAERPSAAIPDPYARANYDVSPDGQRFLMLRPSEQTGAAPTQINVVLNWFEELKRRVPVGTK